MAHDRHAIQPSWRRVATFAAIGPAALALMALWLGGEYRHAEQTRLDARRANEHNHDVERLFSLLQDAETGQRGYLISNDRSFLEPYEQARMHLRERVDMVEKTTPATGPEAIDLDHLKPLITAKFAEMQRIIDLHDQVGIQAAASALSQGYGKKLMDDIRVVIADMTARGDATLKAKTKARAERTALTQTIIWSTIALIALIAALLGYLFGQGLRLRNRLALEREEAATRQRAIFDSASDAIILINPSGSIETINPAAERMFDYRAGDLLRRDISTLVDLAAGEGPFLDRLGLEGERLRKSAMMDMIGRDRGGEPVPVDIVLGVMPLPDGVHIVAALRDASERKELERLKDEFISTVSHELRTPLTSVLGSLSLLRAGAAGALPDPAQRLADIAENNCQRLIRLINDILDIDQIRSGRMTFHYDLVDLRDIAGQTAAAMQGLADRKSISIALDIADEPMTVYADTERLVQVAGNLLSNAIQYSPEGSTVRLEIAEETDRHVVRIIDRGPGVDPQFARHIFERFSQGARPDHQIISGSGLGLAISSEIVHNHGGDIWFDNLPEGGACFAFSVPRHRTKDEIVDRAPRRLLVCEDDPDAGAMIQLMLTANGYASDLVTTVRDAADAIRADGYGAVLLDLTLADADGMDVIRAMRTAEGGHSHPVIIISGARPSQLHQTVESANIVEWLQKPFDTHNLMRAVERALAQHHRTKATVLHIDDDGDMQELFSKAMAGRAHVVSTNTVAATSRLLSQYRPDIVVLDLGLPDGSGVNLLPKLVDRDGERLPTVIYSAQDVSSDVRAAVNAVLIKSRRSLPDLVSTVMAIADNRNERSDA